MTTEILLQHLKINVTNVDNVAFFVNHDISVVSVFDLEEESDDAVGRHRRDEVPAGSLERLRALLSELLLEVEEEIGVGLATNLVPRFRIRNAFDHATLQGKTYGKID